jgi:hypothetical protein
MNTPVTEQVWPNFFIVGAMKAGTTSLYRYLENVPEIFLPKIKEPNYFASKEIPLDSFREIVVRSKTHYLSLFENARGYKRIGEASTDYLYSKVAAHQIKETISSAKIIMILRDPIERAYSHYLASVNYKYLDIHNLSFYDAVRKDYNKNKKGIGISLLYVEGGLYFENVKRYLELFGKDNVLILFFEEFIRETPTHIKRVLEFLEIKSQPPINTDTVYNNYFYPSTSIGQYLYKTKTIIGISKIIPESTLKNKVRKYFWGEPIKKPELTEDAREYLFEIFKKDVNDLRHLVGRPLPWKNFI